MMDPRKSSGPDWRDAYLATSPPITEGYPPGTVPDHTMTDEEVEGLELIYPDHDPATTFVVSGPLGPSGHGPGRRFNSAALAELWARSKYGSARRIKDAEPGGRWAMRVPKPRSDDAAK